MLASSHAMAPPTYPPLVGPVQNSAPPTGVAVENIAMTDTNTRASPAPMATSLTSRRSKTRETAQTSRRSGTAFAPDAHERDEQVA